MVGKVRKNQTKMLSVDTLCLSSAISVIDLSASKCCGEGFNSDRAIVKMLNNSPQSAHGKPQEVSQLALLLAKDDSGFVNDSCRQIEGGISCALKDLDCSLKGNYRRYQKECRSR
jgi:gluconate 5-dehydrogenase